MILHIVLIEKNSMVFFGNFARLYSMITKKGVNMVGFDIKEATKKLNEDIAFINLKTLPEDQKQGMIFLLQREFNEKKELAEIRKRNLDKRSK